MLPAAVEVAVLQAEHTMGLDTKDQCFLLEAALLVLHPFLLVQGILILVAVEVAVMLVL